MESLAGGTVTMPGILFCIFATIAIASALMVILKNNPVASAFSLILCFFSFAGIYALLGAHFIAALQVLVYTGAIMVLFVFVIMLLNADEPVKDLESTSRFVVLTAAVLSGFLVWALFKLFGPIQSIQPRALHGVDVITAAGGNVMAISAILFSDHVFAFELASFLLLGAIVATIALAKRKRSQT
jgi:NADH-quinone oxidoreductase subunit J